MSCCIDDDEVVVHYSPAAVIAVAAAKQMSSHVSLLPFLVSYVGIGAAAAGYNCR